MKKLLLLSLIFVMSMFQTAFAEKIAVKITPIQVISTNKDEIELGDWIGFELVNDVYKDDVLYLKKGSKVIGIVDFFHPNGWAGDAADIKFKNFSTIDVNNKKVDIVYPLNINGNVTMTTDMKQRIMKAPFALFRGSEIYIEPDTTIYNIFIEQ